MNRPLSPAVFGLTVLPLLAVAVILALLTMPDQPTPARYAAVVVLSYLLGSVPWGYMLLLWRRGVDIREYGSGRTGMTNVLRTAGGKVAALVFVLDVSKGALAVMLSRAIIGATEAEVAAGLAALVGHIWPVFLQFRGGRGILTGFGGLSVMAPLVAAIAAAVFIFTTLLSRYVSLGNIIGVVIAFLCMLAFGLAGTYSSAYALYVFVGGAMIIWQHRDNIQRLREGSERRLGHPAGKLN